MNMRVGNGFDIHRLVEGRRLILGGIEIPYEKGLLGHSDGDALAHAIADSILGAAGMGDIGMYFSPDDPKYKDANSIELLEQVVKSAKAHGYHVVNVDSVIICERPKLLPFYPRMRSALAQALGIAEDRVSLKARTMEGLGVIGRGDAIAVEAVVLLNCQGGVS
jgi:2-C-methyl-D-erythritol 2,4-cyclodiphosphate synthase